MRTYTYDKAVSIKQQWPKFKLEKDLIPRKLAEHMEKGWNGINL